MGKRQRSLARPQCNGSESESAIPDTSHFKPCSHAPPAFLLIYRLLSRHIRYSSSIASSLVCDAFNFVANLPIIVIANKPRPSPPPSPSSSTLDTSVSPCEPYIAESRASYLTDNARSRRYPAPPRAISAQTKRTTLISQIRFSHTVPVCGLSSPPISSMFLARTLDQSASSGDSM